MPVDKEKQFESDLPPVSCILSVFCISVSMVQN